jgi:hypothetical protein
MALTLDTKDTSSRIRELVWGGFWPDDEIGWRITDEYLDPDDLSEEDIAWVNDEVARVCAEKRAAEASWPAQTEFDRLESVFAQLRAEKILALHQAGNSNSDGFSDLREAYHAAGGRESGIWGGCFYHSQDVDRAVRAGDLYLAYTGAMIPQPELRAENTLKVAGRIVELLRAAEFDAQWDGNPDTRISLEMGQWRKRSPGRA